MTQEEINALDYYYFMQIKNAFETNGMTFLKTICSAFPVKETWEEYTNKKSCFQEALERCIQSTITNNFDWEICGTPVGADSVFVTPKAIIHIDAKCVLNTDNDAKNNCLSVGPNQSSYSSEVMVSINNKEFKTNLPAIYHHEIYGDLVCLTYFIKVCYDKSFDSTFCSTLTISLNSFPNGMLSNIYGNGFLKIGKINDAEIIEVLTHTEFLRYKKKSNDEGKATFDACYDYYRLPTKYLPIEVQEDDEAKENLEELYVERLIRTKGDNSKNVNGKKFEIIDYVILDDEAMEFIENNYAPDDRDTILALYEEVVNSHILKSGLKSQDKTKLKSAYKRLNLNTYAKSIRIDFDKVSADVEEDSCFNWKHSQVIELK